LPRLRGVGFKAYSQTDEDGILLYLFSLIGTTNRRCVEICAGDGLECNTANLIIHHGWSGLLVDGDARLVARGQACYRRHRATYVRPPTFVCSWVTAENVNALLREHGFDGAIDLLSLDLDGIDYWIWNALEAARPRVVVVEYQDILGPERTWTVPYQADFDHRRYPTTGGRPNFAGASLTAFARLAARKGYRLVGVNRCEYNAFFVQGGQGDAVLPGVSVASCFQDPSLDLSRRERFETVRHLPWVEV
jgi:hypothetical protein